MKILAITGPFGSGKTTVTHFVAGALRSSGANVAIIALDKVSRDILDADLQLRKKLAKAFGGDILLEDTSLNRKALAEVAFLDDYATAKLNALVHPPTMERACELLQDAHAEKDVAVIESPFPLSYLSEIFTGLNNDADAGDDVEIWMVCADKETRLLRGVADGYSSEDALQRMDRQPRVSAYQLEANYTIENDGDLDDLRQELQKCLQKSNLLKIQ